MFSLKCSNLTKGILDPAKKQTNKKPTKYSIASLNKSDEEIWKNYSQDTPTPEHTYQFLSFSVQWVTKWGNGEEILLILLQAKISHLDTVQTVINGIDLCLSDWKPGEGDEVNHHDLLPEEGKCLDKDHSCLTCETVPACDILDYWKQSTSWQLSVYNRELEFTLFLPYRSTHTHLHRFWERSQSS